MQRYADWFRDNEGRGYPNAVVTVYNAGTSVKPLLYFADGDIYSPGIKSNPFVTDANGFFSFAIPNGVYDILLEGSGIPSTRLPNIAIGTTTVSAIDASSVSFSPVGGISSTNTQAAVVELDSKALHKAGYEAVTGVKEFITQPTGITASSIVNIPALGVTSIDVQGAINEKVTANVAIVGATKTKVTYDTKGLITGGADATTSDITESANRLFVKDGDYGDVVVSSGGTVWRDPSPVFQCRLDYVSATTVRLNRYRGKYLTINGVRYEIPAAGVDLSSTGLATATLLYVYAYMSGATMTLEASSTAWALDSTSGTRIKNGDATRVFVGWVYLLVANTFSESSSQKLVISWHNPVCKEASANLTSMRTTSSTTIVELNSESRIHFISTGNNSVRMALHGSAWTTTLATNVFVALTIDGTAIAYGLAQTLYAASSITVFPIGLIACPPLSEGYHWATISGYVSSAGGTLNVEGGATTGTRATTVRAALEG